jgi:RecB family exonuclease
MSVRRLLAEVDSEELAEWYAYHQRWPLDDGWQQTARLCSVVCAASGNFKRAPKEADFIPTAVTQKQTSQEMLAELAKLGGAKLSGGQNGTQPK